MYPTDLMPSILYPQMSISLSSLGASAGGSTLSRSLPPPEQDALQSWLALIMLTLHEVGTQVNDMPPADSSVRDGLKASASPATDSSNAAAASCAQAIDSTMETAAAPASGVQGRLLPPLLSADAPEALRQFLKVCTRLTNARIRHVTLDLHCVD